MGFLSYLGITELNIDFAFDSMSSATLVWSRPDSPTPSARRSSGGRAGMSAGGVGRRGSSVRAAAAYGGFIGDDPELASIVSAVGGAETMIGDGSGRTAGASTT